MVTKLLDVFHHQPDRDDDTPIPFTLTAAGLAATEHVAATWSSCNVLVRVQLDRAMGKDTSPAALAFVRRTCPCDGCRRERQSKRGAR